MRWLTFWLVAVLLGCTEAAVPLPDGGTARFAAVAIRDVVPRSQVVGTRLYALPKLEGAYAHTIYIEETARGTGRPAFVIAVKDAATRFDSVDLYLLAHGNPYVAWMEDVPAPLRRKVRLVYNTGGGGSDQAQRWVDAGAQAYVSHPGGNIAPLFLAEFLPLWLADTPLDVCVRDANALTRGRIFSGPANLAMKAFVGVTGERDARADLWAGTEAQVDTARPATASAVRFSRP